MFPPYDSNFLACDTRSYRVAILGHMGYPDIYYNIFFAYVVLYPILFPGLNGMYSFTSLPLTLFFSFSRIEDHLPSSNIPTLDFGDNCAPLLKTSL